MNQMTFQAIGWFIGSAVFIALAAALAVSAKRNSNDMDKFTLAAVAGLALIFASYFFGFGWQSLSFGLFGGAK